MSILIPATTLEDKKTAYNKQLQQLSWQTDRGRTRRRNMIDVSSGPLWLKTPTTVSSVARLFPNGSDPVRPRDNFPPTVPAAHPDYRPSGVARAFCRHLDDRDGQRRPRTHRKAGKSTGARPGDDWIEVARNADSGRRSRRRSCRRASRIRNELRNGTVAPPCHRIANYVRFLKTDL